MKVIEINITDFGSTGRIMHGIRKVASSNNIKCITYSLKAQKHANRNIEADVHFFSNFYEYALHYYLSKFTGSERIGSYLGTLSLIHQIKRITPDIIPLHNIHGRYINIPLLFRYIKKSDIKVVWTLHDCWAFTGHCPHFSYQNCYKWKTGCYNCPRFKEYPDTIFDDSKKMYNLKKRWFTGVNSMTLVTPSHWLADLTRQSYMKEYPVRVIHNGIDLSVFKPTDSDFRKEHHCEDKKILLGVAFGWGKRKGLDVFVELAKRLDSQYQIVLVGVDERVQLSLPKNIISIERTQNQQELAQIYSAADLFVNPTREENYPTVNMESLACGTPVLTFRTGGSPEIIDDRCGAVVDKDDIDAMEREIIRICSQMPYKREDILKRAESFDMADRFNEYVSLYHEVIAE